MRRKQNIDIPPRSGCCAVADAVLRLLLIVVPSAYVMALAVAAPKVPWLGLVVLVPLLLTIQTRRPHVAMIAVSRRRLRVEWCLVASLCPFGQGSFDFVF